MPKYTVEIRYRLGGKDQTSIQNVEERTVKLAKDLAVLKMYMSTEEKKRKSILISETNCARIREVVKTITSNQRKRAKRNVKITK